MKGLTLTLPYSYLIAAAATRPDLGKCWETRDRASSYRGPLAIHAAENLRPVGGKDGLLELCETSPFREALAVLGLSGVGLMDSSRRGVIVAVVQFRGAGRVIWQDGPAVQWGAKDVSRVEEPELSFGDFNMGRRIWRLDAIRALPVPVRCRGAMGLWDVPADVEAVIREQL